MGKQRSINTDFWNDAWVVDILNPLDRYLFIYLLTNSQTNLTGCYELSLRIMSFQTGIDKEELSRMLKRLEPKVYYVDGYIILINGIKNQNYKNSNINIGIIRECENIPSHVLQHVRWPKDFGKKKPKGSNQQQFFDDSVVTQVSTKPNLTKPNLTKPGAKAPIGEIEKPKADVVKVLTPYDRVSKLFYEAVNALELPVLNHNVLKKKISEMSKMQDQEMVLNYLTFMRDHYAVSEWDYKPDVNTALDIFSKRVQIRNSLSRAQKAIEDRKGVVL